MALTLRQLSINKIVEALRLRGETAPAIEMKKEVPNLPEALIIDIVVKSMEYPELGEFSYNLNQGQMRRKQIGFKFIMNFIKTCKP